MAGDHCTLGLATMAAYTKASAVHHMEGRVDRFFAVHAGLTSCIWVCTTLPKIEPSPDFPLHLYKAPKVGLPHCHDDL